MELIEHELGIVIHFLFKSVGSLDIPQSKPLAKANM